MYILHYENTEATREEIAKIGITINVGRVYNSLIDKRKSSGKTLIKLDIGKK